MNNDKYPYSILIFILISWASCTLAKQGLDSDSFFLLDADSSCIDANYLLKSDSENFRNSPKILEPGKFMIFEPNSSVITNPITTIDELDMAVKEFFSSEQPRKGIEFHSKLMSRITPDSLSSILKSILNDPTRLDTIAKSSYTHVMGFVKIVLLSGPKDNNYKVRLHLWWPNPDIDAEHLILEDKHIHKWSFASKMFSGSFEDQLYLINELRREEALKYVDFIEEVEKLSTDEQQIVFDSLDVIEAAMLQETKFYEEKFRCAISKNKVYTKDEIMKKFDLSELDFNDIIRVHENYITLPNITGKYGLSRVGLKHLSFPVVYEINEGYSYFHHHSIGHRLISDPDDMVSTFIITSPPIEEKQPSILMRTSADDVTKTAPILGREQLVKNIKRYIDFLQKRK